MGKKWMAIRHCSHANSGRRIAENFDEDAREAREYTDSVFKNRHGVSEEAYPSDYSDFFIYTKKYATKPKANHHKGGKTIRRPDDDDDMSLVC